MAKFKTGDKVVLEITGIEMIGPIENMYNTSCGMRIKVTELDKAASFEERAEALKEALKEAVKKEASKKTTKKAAKK